MRYLKLFEDINSDGYESIRYDKYYNYEGFCFVLTDFTEKELLILKQLIPTMETCSNTVSNKNDSVTFRQNVTDRRGILYPIEVWINKSTDEWFYVDMGGNRRDGKFFKCDQLDGLIDCLRNELV